MEDCPFFVLQINAAATVCRYCGKTLAQGEERLANRIREKQMQEEQLQASVDCPFCGRQINAAATVCRYCSKTLT
jgi:ribosomal protein L24E